MAENFDVKLNDIVKELGIFKSEILRVQATLVDLQKTQVDKEVKLKILDQQIQHTENHLEKINTSIEKLRQEIKSDYVSSDKFNPIQLLVYGFVSLVLTAVIVAILATIL